jgi:hypothetical protein
MPCALFYYFYLHLCFSLLNCAPHCNVMQEREAEDDLHHLPQDHGARLSRVRANHHLLPPIAHQWQHYYR